DEHLYNPTINLRSNLMHPTRDVGIVGLFEGIQMPQELAKPQRHSNSDDHKKNGPNGRSIRLLLRMILVRQSRTRRSGFFYSNAHMNTELKVNGLRPRQ